MSKIHLLFKYNVNLYESDSPLGIYNQCNDFLNVLIHMMHLNNELQ